MRTLILNGTPFAAKELDAVDESFYSNFVVRWLYKTYQVPLSEITRDKINHALHDLNVVRYRAWLMIRNSGVSLQQMGSLVTDENVVDVYSSTFGNLADDQPVVPTIQEHVDNLRHLMKKQSEEDKSETPSET